MKRLLITICGRAGSKGFKNKNLKNFCGKPLVYYSLSAAELFIRNHPELEVDIALNTDSEDLAKLVAAEYPEVIYLPRGAELGGDRVPKVEVYKDSFARMEARTGKPYDAMIDLDITSPLRTEQDIENAFAKAQEREDLQIIFSVCEARRNPWFAVGNFFQAAAGPAATRGSICLKSWATTPKWSWRANSPAASKRPRFTTSMRRFMLSAAHFWWTTRTPSCGIPSSVSAL